MIGRDDVGVGADAQTGGVHAARLEHPDLLEQRLEVHHDAVADHGGDLRGEYSGRKELELELLAVDDHGVAGVVASVGLDDVVDALSEQVGGLALPLVAPLGSDDHDGGHGDSWDEGAGCGRTTARILPSTARVPARRVTTRTAPAGSMRGGPGGRRGGPPGQSGGAARAAQSSRLGSASRRKSVMRSASGWSPRRRETSPSSASARSTPRLGAWEAGIGPWPRQPLRRSASRPRW